MTSRLAFLGADPGLAHFGACLLEVAGDNVSLFAVEVFKTEKDDKKIMSASEDNYARAVSLYLQLKAFLALYPGTIWGCGVEAMSHPQSSSAASKLSMSWGVFAATLTEAGIPAFHKSPQKIKQALLGRISATKEEVMDAVSEKIDMTSFKQRYRKTLWEHGFDAVAAALATLDDEVLKEARRLL